MVPYPLGLTPSLGFVSTGPHRTLVFFAFVFGPRLLLSFVWNQSASLTARWQGFFGLIFWEKLPGGFLHPGFNLIPALRGGFHYLPPCCLIGRIRRVENFFHSNFRQSFNLHGYKVGVLD